MARATAHVMLDPDARARALERNGFNVLTLAAGDVPYDLFSDCPHRIAVPEIDAAARAASDQVDDERLFERLGELYGPACFALASKGRAAELALVHALGWKRPIIATHGLFSTTQRALARCDAELVGVPIAGDGRADLDLAALHAVMAERAVNAVYIELANNGCYGWPVGEIHELRALCTRHGAKLLVDATRVFTNATLLEQSWARARDMLALADAFTVSLGKELAIPVGAIVASRDRQLVGRARLFCFEHGTALEPPWAWGAVAAAVEHLLRHPDALVERGARVAALARRLAAAGVRVAQPSGGHAVFVALQSQDNGLEPMLSLLAHLYAIAGVRGFIGTYRGVKMLRLAIPLHVLADDDIVAIADGVAAFTRVETAAPRLRAIGGQDERVPYFQRLERVA